MTEALQKIISLLDHLGIDDLTALRDCLRQKVPLHPIESEWGTTAEAILSAIARSSDLTQRGIRGILAEATLEHGVIPKMKMAGWQTVTIEGHHAYDFQLRKGDSHVTIQVKLQRRERGIPKEYAGRSRARLVAPVGRLFVVEVQKTRSGERGGEKTRPYRYGDFDILAVNMHPSSANWSDFRYTLGRWLLPRSSDNSLIEIFQPVAENPDDFWTDDLSIAIDWLQSGISRTLYS